MRADYAVYLKSDHWRSLRCEAITRWGDRCANCSVPKVDVHHLRYGTLYDVTTDDLMPLCRRCHDTVHQSRRLRELLASEESSDFKRKTVVGFLAGRDEAITKKVPYQSPQQIQGEAMAILRQKEDAAKWRKRELLKKFTKPDTVKNSQESPSNKTTKRSLFVANETRSQPRWKGVATKSTRTLDSSLLALVT